MENNCAKLIRLAFIAGLLLSLATPLTFAQTATPSPDRSAQTASPTPSESSRAVLELKLQTVAKEIADLDDGTKQVEHLQVIVQAALVKIVPGAGPSLDQKIQTVNAAFQKLKDAWKTNNVPNTSNAVTEFSGAIYSLEVTALSTGNIELESIRTTASPRFGAAQIARIPATILTLIEQQRSAFYLDQKWREQLPNLYRFYVAGREKGVSGVSELPAKFLPGGPETLPIQEAGAELSKLSDVFGDLARRNIDSKREALKAVDEAAAAEITQAKKELEKKKQEELDLDKKLKAKEDTQASIADETSGKLQYIFWGIMAAIIATLAILRIKGDEQSRLMIRERTAVEMLSIGMFLTTVLFLGTGGFIEKATLGTLLGTLAGYLFTRRPGTAADTATTTPDRPETPGKATYNKGTNKVSLPSLPKNADHVTVYARPAAGGAEIVLGASNTAEVSIDTGKLTPGAYKAWVVATNVSGGSSKGAEFDLTKE